MRADPILSQRPAPVAPLPLRRVAKSVTFSMARSVMFSMAIDSLLVLLVEVCTPEIGFELVSCTPLIPTLDALE